MGCAQSAPSSEAAREPRNRKPPPPEASIDPTPDDSSQRTVTTTAPMSILLHGDPGFHCSANGRNGFTLEQIYEQRSSEPFLGEGEFGYVYKRYHNYEGTNVAVKRTRPTPMDLHAGEITTYDDICHKCQEVRTLLRLRSGGGGASTAPRHQPILELYEFFWDGCQLNLVTELLGMNLREWLSVQQTFSEEQAKTAAKSILTGLRRMSQMNVVHRDIKDENIMFRVADDLSSLKICDFGFAQELVNGAPTTGACGSLGYLAPEIYSGVSYGTEVDMFSFGVVLFRMLSAEKPWPSAPPRVTRAATLQLQYRVDNRRWRMVSEHGRDLVRRLLAYSPDRLTPAEALRHPWFGERSDSILQAGPSFYAPGARPPTSRAIIAAGDNGSNSSSSRNTARFLLDRSVQSAVAYLHENGDLHGRFVAWQNGERLYEESFPDRTAELPIFVSSLARYTELECRKIFRQMVFLVKKFHHAGLAHRNMNPSSFIVVPGEGADGFRLRVRGIQYALRSTSERPMTGRVGHSNTAYDWFAYVAPEIDTRFDHDSRVDLWSLGALLYTLLCGLGPFTGTGAEILEKKNTGVVQFEVVQPSLHAQELVGRLLRVEPGQRMGVDQILGHAWMTAPDVDLGSERLDLARRILSDWERTNVR